MRMLSVFSSISGRSSVRRRQPSRCTARSRCCAIGVTSESKNSRAASLRHCVLLTPVLDACDFPGAEATTTVTPGDGGGGGGGEGG